jgi:4'-phosphopantetheinyl transferase
MASESLPADEIHVWSAALDQAAELVAALEALLGAPERERAERIRVDHVRDRFVVGRGLLRTLLGRYVGARPQDLLLTYGEHGKPFLAQPGPWFNLSHSGGLALFAFSSSAEVGVDVELADRRVDPLRIAGRFFSPGEVATLRSLPEALQRRAFLTCWTRKEAFIKARGDGLSLPLDSFDVTLAPFEPAALTRTAWSDGEPAEWELADLSDPQAGTVAAVAARRRGWRVVRREVAGASGLAVAGGAAGPEAR